MAAIWITVPPRFEHAVIPSPSAEQIEFLQKAVDNLRSSANAQVAFLAIQQQAVDVLKQMALASSLPTFAELQGSMNALRSSQNAQAAILIEQQAAIDSIKRKLPKAKVVVGSASFLIGSRESYGG